MEVRGEDHRREHLDPPRLIFMNRVPVKSSNVKSIAYDAEKKLIEVEFHNGGVYQYHGITPEEHAALLHSPVDGSHGRHLHQLIKGRHAHTKVS
jgi:hypothetical protein